MGQKFGTTELEYSWDRTHGIPIKSKPTTHCVLVDLKLFCNSKESLTRELSGHWPFKSNV